MYLLTALFYNLLDCYRVNMFWFLWDSTYATFLLFCQWCDECAGFFFFDLMNVLGCTGLWWKWAFKYIGLGYLRIEACIRGKKTGFNKWTGIPSALVASHAGPGEGNRPVRLAPVPGIVTLSRRVAERRRWQRSFGRERRRTAERLRWTGQAFPCVACSDEHAHGLPLWWPAAWRS